MNAVTDLQKEWSTWKDLNKLPFEGCLKIPGSYAAWDCCDYHRKLALKNSEILLAALELTKTKFPEALIDSSYKKRDADMPKNISHIKCLINGENLFILSERWWELISRT